MLLSLLSKRLLEVDSRDSYGFALRPQHTQRYREYSYIYKEEEGERSSKWKNFLEQLVIYDQPCSSKETNKEVLEVEDAKQITETSSSVRPCEGDDTTSEKKSGCDSSEERKTKKVQTWVNVRSSLGVIEHMMSCRVKKIMKDKQINLGEDCLPPMEDTEKDFNEQVFGNNHDVLSSSPTENVNDSVAEQTQTVCDGLDGGNTEQVVSDHGVFDEVDGVISTDDDDVFDEVDDAMSDKVEGDIVSNTVDAVQQEKVLDDSVSDCLDAASPKQALSDERPPYPWKELEFLVQGGVPKDIRGEVWQAFVGVKTRRVERYYHDLLVEESSMVEIEDQTWKRQIEKDIPRTFPGHPALDENGRNSLRRLLIAYARHNPSVGYCQGMNFFAGIMLLLMPEENAFWTLVGIIDDYFDGYYTEQMIESQVDQLVFEELMRERFPKLVNHLDYLGVQVTWLSGPWFLSIFVNMLPWESVLRIWDVLLYEGNRVMLFRTALALMELYGPALVTTKDAGDAISLLQSLAGSTFDSSQLVLTACMGFMTITEARLQELREKHRPAVLMVIEERSRGGRVWKDSKGLASKLYSFKHDRAIVEEKKNNGANDKHTDGNKSEKDPHSANLDYLLECLGGDTELESLPLEDQVGWLKVELCRLMDEKRSAVLRAEELETAFMEMVKEDNRLELSARVEQLEQEVAELQEALADKKEQEAAMIQVFMRLEQEQKLTEDARLNAEQDVAAQKYAVHVLQEKHDKAVASLADMEKRVLMAESMLEATLQYESGQTKAVCSPRFARNQVSTPDNKGRIGRLAFGFGWRDRNKSQVKVDECGEANPNTPQKKTSEEKQENLAGK